LNEALYDTAPRTRTKRGEERREREEREAWRELIIRKNREEMPATKQELSLLINPLVPESVQHNNRVS
jgi:hypothetical protein